LSRRSCAQNGTPNTAPCGSEQASQEGAAPCCATPRRLRAFFCTFLGAACRPRRRSSCMPASKAPQAVTGAQRRSRFKFMFRQPIEYAGERRGRQAGAWQEVCGVSPQARRAAVVPRYEKSAPCPPELRGGAYAGMHVFPATLERYAAPQEACPSVLFAAEIGNPFPTFPPARTQRTTRFAPERTPAPTSKATRCSARGGGNSSARQSEVRMTPAAPRAATHQNPTQVRAVRPSAEGAYATQRHDAGDTVVPHREDGRRVPVLPVTARSGTGSEEGSPQKYGEAAPLAPAAPSAVKEGSA